jgi:EAL domain-containing protein (putative c-di-GMP-specific phosphodiesterase class I)
LAFLKDQQCELLQGYLFSRPATTEQLQADFKESDLKPLLFGQ